MNVKIIGSTQPELVRFERRGDIGVVMLNRPECRNAINHALRVALVEALRIANADSSTRAVVLTGAADHLCGGGDLTGMDERDISSVHDRMRMAAEVVRLIRRSPKPYVAAVEGSAYGAGLSLALACDQIIAAKSARFCAVFIKAGLVPDYGIMNLLPARVGDGTARRMMMTGCVVDADEALRTGLADRVVAESTALEVALECAKQFGMHAPVALRLMKAAMADGRTSTLEACLNVEADLQAQLFQTQDFTEVLGAFKERRAPVFKGR